MLLLVIVILSVLLEYDTSIFGNKVVVFKNVASSAFVYEPSGIVIVAAPNVYVLLLRELSK